MKNSAIERIVPISGVALWTVKQAARSTNSSFLFPKHMKKGNRKFDGLLLSRVGNQLGSEATIKKMTLADISKVQNMSSRCLDSGYTDWQNFY